MSYVLAQSLSDVDEYLQQDHPKGWMGTDTEATRLDTRKAKLVGISLSLKPETAIYIPIGHKLGTNLPLGPVWERIQRKLETHKPIFYNAKYDLTILQVALHKFGMKQPATYEDALELVYLADPDRKRKNLKTVAKEDLGFYMEKFEDLFTEAEKRSGILDISGKSPQRCLDYASADADATLRVKEKYNWVAEQFPMAVRVDTPLIDIVRLMEHNGGLELNREYIEEKITELEELAATLKEQIFRVVGYDFELNSPKQLGIALFEKLGIPSPGKTQGKNPIHITKEEVLEKLRSAYPVVELVISYRKVVKARSSYFAKLKYLLDAGIKPRFNFNMFAAPTFRFAAPGGDPDVDGATGVNIQAVSNGESREIMGVLLKEAPPEEDYAAKVSEDDILIDLRQELPTPTEDQADWTGDLRSLPYVREREAGDLTCIRETCQACPARCDSRGIDLTRRVQKGVRMIPSVRQAFRAPDGWKLVSFDYDRQELVIGANMSREPRWLRALAQGDDLHVITASAAFGIPVDQFMMLPKDEFKRKRDVGKVLNFATFYGATAYTLAIKADISKAAAEQIYDGFVRGHPVLFGWIKKVHIFAKKNGYTTTYFGRKRSLKKMYDDPSPRMQAFANRSAVNTAIQGTAAEVTRIAMVKTAKMLKDKGYTWNEVKFALQIHDELDFLVRDELVKEVVPLIKQAMEFNVKNWEVQLTVGPKISQVWGRPFLYPIEGGKKTDEVDVVALQAGSYDEFLKAA